jgi:hypothetical protein
MVRDVWALVALNVFVSACDTHCISCCVQYFLQAFLTAGCCARKCSLHALRYGAESESKAHLAEKSGSEKEIRNSGFLSGFPD